MKIEIDAVGKHIGHDGLPKCRMVVDGTGVLVDLKGLPGPLMDPSVERVEWGPYGENYTDALRIHRRSGNNANDAIDIRLLPSKDVLGPYLEAYKVRLAEALGK